MDFNFDNIDSNIEQTESEVESTVEKLESIESKQESIQSALHKLQEDIEASSVLSGKLAEREAEKQELLKEIEKYRDIAHNLEAQINEMIEANNDSQSVLKELELLGEDIQEGLGTIAERQLLIEQCKEQLQLLMDKLNMAGAFSDSLSESGGEADDGYHGKTGRNAFVQSIKASPWKSSESDTDSDTSSESTASSSTSGDPARGSRQLQKGDTVAMGRDDGFFSDISALWSSKKQDAFGDEDDSVENNQGHIRNQILVGRVDPRIDEFGWKRKEEIFTLEGDLKAVNPDFYTATGKMTSDERWTRNCQRCVIALEARFRGADVKAAARILDGTDTLPIMSHPRGWLSVFENARPVNCSGNTGLDTGINVLKEMRKNGDGSRAIVRIQRCNTIQLPNQNGQLQPFAIEKVNGNTVVCTPASRTPVNLSSYFPGCDLSEGVEEIIVPNKSDPHKTEQILVSKKDGKQLATIQSHGGHVFTAIQKNGKTIFCDSQTGKIIQEPKLYFALAKRDQTYVVRVDHLRFTDRAMDCCEPRA